MTFGQYKDFCYNCGALLHYDGDRLETETPWLDVNGSPDCQQGTAQHISEDDYYESIKDDHFADQPREGK